MRGKLEGPERAREQARAEVDKLTADAVADEAVALRAWDLEAGSAIREKWANVGLRSESASPGAFFDHIFTFWWEHRDALREDDRVIAGLRKEVDALKTSLDPTLRRKRAAEVVFKAVLLLALLGQTVSPETVALLQEAAERLA